jgi:hypothetical protein
MIRISPHETVRSEYSIDKFNIISMLTLLQYIQKYVQYSQNHSA